LLSSDREWDGVSSLTLLSPALSISCKHGLNQKGKFFLGNNFRAPFVSLVDGKEETQGLALSWHEFLEFFAAAAAITTASLMATDFFRVCLRPGVSSLSYLHCLFVFICARALDSVVSLTRDYLGFALAFLSLLLLLLLLPLSRDRLHGFLYPPNNLCYVCMIKIRRIFRSSSF
jgi:hypothetical protein